MLELNNCCRRQRAIRTRERTALEMPAMTHPESAAAQYLASGLDHQAAGRVDDALAAFEQIAPRQAKVVELRYFGGLNEEEIVEVLKISPRTVRRDWEFARVWLAREIHA